MASMAATGRARAPSWWEQGGRRRRRACGDEDAGGARPTGGRLRVVRRGQRAAGDHAVGDDRIEVLEVLVEQPLVHHTPFRGNEEDAALLAEGLSDFRHLQTIHGGAERSKPRLSPAPPSPPPAPRRRHTDSAKARRNPFTPPCSPASTSWASTPVVVSSAVSAQPGTRAPHPRPSVSGPTPRRSAQRVDARSADATYGRLEPPSSRWRRECGRSRPYPSPAPSAPGPHPPRRRSRCWSHRARARSRATDCAAFPDRG